VRSAWALRRKAGETGAHLAHARLQLGVGILPEVHEAAVAVGGLGAVALGLVQLARALEAAAQLFQDAVLVADRGLKPVLEIDRSAPEGDACKVRRLETEG